MSENFQSVGRFFFLYSFMVFCTFYHIGCCQFPFVRELLESSLDFLEVLGFAFSVP